MKVSSPDQQGSHHGNRVVEVVDDEDEVSAEVKSIMKEARATEEGEGQETSPDGVQQPSDPPRNYGGEGGGVWWG